MSTSYKSCFMTEVVFYSKDKVDNDFLVPWDEVDFLHVFECRIGLNIVDLKCHCILPEGVSILFIIFKRLFNISWNLYTKTIHNGFSVPTTIVTQACLIDHTLKFLLVLGNVFDALPTSCVNETIFSCLPCNRNWIIFHEDIKWLTSFSASFPLH